MGNAATKTMSDAQGRRVHTDTIAGASETEARAESRRFHRIAARMPVSLLLANGSECRGHLIDISAGGLAIETDRRTDVGDKVIAYVDQLGRFEGEVVRQLSSGFAIEFVLGASRRRKLIEQLMVLLEQNGLEDVENRRHKRQEVNFDLELESATGHSAPCRVRDISLSGAYIEVCDPPEVGEVVRVGKMRGKVIRKDERGIALEFMTEA